jgi:hypothetical protein
MNRAEKGNGVTWRPLACHLAPRSGLLVVGPGADEYAFNLAGDGARRDTALYDLMGRSTLALAWNIAIPLDTVPGSGSARAANTVSKR